MTYRIEFTRTDNHPGGELSHVLTCESFVQLTYEELRLGPDGDFVASNQPAGTWKLHPDFAEGVEDEEFTDIVISAVPS